MNSHRSGNGPAGFTLIELLCVVCIIGILAALLLPALGQAKARTKRVACISNLHQVGIAFQAFAHDHQGKFPMSVSTNQGGSQEFLGGDASLDVSASRVARHFASLAFELVTPRVIACPSDSRLPAASFGLLESTNVSYFAGGGADPALPNSLLSGDRNLTNDYSPSNGSVEFGPNNFLRWTHELHRFKGNLLFADGRVEQRQGLGLVADGSQRPPTMTIYLPDPGASGASGSTPAVPATSTPAARGGSGSGALAPSASNLGPDSWPAPASQQTSVRSNSKPATTGTFAQKPRTNAVVETQVIAVAPAVAEPADWIAGARWFGLFVLLVLALILALEIRRRMRNRRLRRRLWH